MVWQEEEVQSLQGADLTGVYDQGSMCRMVVEHRLAHLDQPIRSDSMTPEGMREVHVRRLRGPWGRLYVKEMAKLRQLLPSLDIALPDFNGERRAIEQREPCDRITRNNSNSCPLSPLVYSSHSCGACDRPVLRPCCWIPHLIRACVDRSYVRPVICRTG